jgi:diguanylate cyclase (GGDEF)-like protein/PAS domain S-box-containing protein
VEPGAPESSVPLEVLLEASSDLLTVHDENGVVLYANAACEPMLGLRPEELVGTDPFRLVHPDDRDRLIAQMIALREHPEPVHVVRVRVRHRDGGFRHVESLVRNRLDDPALHAVLMSTRAVSRWVRAQEAVVRSELRHRRLVEEMPVGLAVVDEAGIIRFANRVALSLVGSAQLSEVVGRAITEFILPDERAEVGRQLRQALAGEADPSPREYHLAGGVLASMVVSASSMLYEWEGRTAVLALVQDVTDLTRARTERSLATERLIGILEASGEGVVGLDVDDRLTFLNAAAADMLGLVAEEVLGLQGHALFHHSKPGGSPYPAQECPCVAAARSGRPTAVGEDVFWRQDGAPVPVEYRVKPLRPDEPSGAVLTFHDVSERLRAQQQLDAAAAVQRAVLDSLPALTAVVDRGGTIVSVNEAWELHLTNGGGTPETCGVGVNVLDVLSRVTGRSRPSALLAAAGLGTVLEGRDSAYQQDVPCPVPDEATTFFGLDVARLRTPDGGAVISYRDITSRKKLEMDAAHRASHDVLTGLPNRTLLLERLEHALTRRRPPSVAVLFLDLDGFKTVNDSYGHDAGDAVLRELAERMKRHVRPSDTVARQSGDEFVVLCEELQHPTEAYQLADRLIGAVAEPFAVGATTIILGASVGVAVASEPLQDASLLLEAADQAMLDAKARGRNRFAVWDVDVRSRHRERLEQGLTLRRLVEQDQLLVHYQPVIDLRDGQIVGSEALLRWQGTTELPDTTTAIALAKETGLIGRIGRIGRFVLHKATSDAATFLRPGGEVLPLSVNLAPQQLTHALIGDVERYAAEAGFPLSRITFELTERSLMAEPGLATEVLRVLRSRGIRIALDNFGVGQSSLAALRDLPLDVLKIDAEFVRGLAGADADSRIIAAIIQMAEALGLDTVAEGVELAEQRDRLLELGCERGQGYLFSPARAPADLRLSASQTAR